MSGLSCLNLWIELLELDPGIRGGELLIDAFLAIIVSGRPDIDFLM